MNNASVVSMSEGFADHLKELEDPIDRGFLATDVTTQGNPVDQLHHDEGSHIVYVIEDANHARMVQHGRGPRFPREATSGVSLDEEAANLVRYQRAFDAASQVIAVIDEMLSTVINQMGLSGR